MEQLSIETMCDGQIVTRFNQEMKRIVSNIQDVKTSKDARELIIKIKIDPDNERDRFVFNVEVTSKLMSHKKMYGNAVIEINSEGQPVAYEPDPEPKPEPLNKIM